LSFGCYYFYYGHSFRVNLNVSLSLEVHTSNLWIFDEWLKLFIIFDLDFNKTLWNIWITNMKAIIIKFKRNLYNYGILITLKKTFYFVVKPVYKKLTYKIYFIELNQFNHLPIRNNNFVYKFVNKDDIKIIRQIEDMEEWLQNRIMDKLNSNCICLAAIDNNTVVGFLIANLNELSIPWINFKKKLKANVCYGEQIAINKKYRRIGLAASLRLRLFEKLRNGGISKFYVGIPTWNKIIRKSLNKFGFNYLVDLSYTKFFMCEGLRLKRVK